LPRTGAVEGAQAEGACRHKTQSKASTVLKLAQAARLAAHPEAPAVPDGLQQAKTVSEIEKQLRAGRAHARHRRRAAA
jgi:hypothetical protein